MPAHLPGCSACAEEATTLLLLAATDAGIDPAPALRATAPGADPVQAGDVRVLIVLRPPDGRAGPGSVPAGARRRAAVEPCGCGGVRPPHSSAACRKSTAEIRRGHSGGRTTRSTRSAYRATSAMSRCCTSRLERLDGDRQRPGRRERPGRTRSRSAARRRGRRPGRSPARWPRCRPARRRRASGPPAGPAAARPGWRCWPAPRSPGRRRRAAPPRPTAGRWRRGAPEPGSPPAGRDPRAGAPARRARIAAQGVPGTRQRQHHPRRPQREDVVPAQRRPDAGELVDRARDVPWAATKTALSAPADVPTSRSGVMCRSPRACSMPTWTAPRLPPPDRTKAVVMSYLARPGAGFLPTRRAESRTAGVHGPGSHGRRLYAHRSRPGDASMSWPNTVA